MICRIEIHEENFSISSWKVRLVEISGDTLSLRVLKYPNDNKKINNNNKSENKITNINKKLIDFYLEIKENKIKIL